MKFNLSGKKKIVIKIGSSLLVEEGELRKKWLKKLVSDIADLVKQNIKVIIVSSGAVALGKSFLNMEDKTNLTIEEKQASAAIGQIYLMSFYRDLFKKMEIDVAQILLTLTDCNFRSRYLNSQNTIKTLLQHNVIPIINENDSIAVDEIKIGDNDRLAARVAQMISADMLILFSDIDGLYDKNPNIHQNAKLIPEVVKVTRKIEKMASGAVSSVGTGGMVTKIKAAKIAAPSGCDTIVADGTAEGSLGKLIAGKVNFTIFHQQKDSSSSRNKWISGLLNVKGEVIVNQRAKEALLGRKSSLLTVGVVGAKGNFKKGDAILIKDEEGIHFANGMSNYSITDLKKVFGKNSQEVTKILKKSKKIELVHIDNLAVI